MPDPVPHLRDHTTLRLGGPGRDWVRATTEAELIGAVSDADAAGTPVLVLGGGSNLVVADAGGLAFEQHCRYPEGNRVVCVTVATVGDGRITRQTIAQSWD